MNALAISPGSGLRSPQHVVSRAASGSLLLHLLAIGGLIIFHDQQEEQPTPPPAIEVALGVAPAPPHAAPAKQTAAPAPREARHIQKTPARQARLASPNPSAEPDATPAVAEAPIEKSAPAPSQAGTGVSAPGPARADSMGAGGNSLPYVVFGPRPVYPPEARASGREGKVRIKVLIFERGAPGEVQLAESSGYASLDEAALDALRRWRFQPALRDGQPIPAWVTVPVIFSLR